MFSVFSLIKSYRGRFLRSYELRPYGGLICIDNSFLDRHSKDSIILQLHAIFHDAAGFIHEFNQEGPT